MRFVTLALFVTLLCACQPSTTTSQNDCGHFPEPEFH